MNYGLWTYRWPDGKYTCWISSVDAPISPRFRLAWTGPYDRLKALIDDGVATSQIATDTFDLTACMKGI